MNTDKRHLERLQKGEEYYRRSSRLTIMIDILDEFLPDLVEGRMNIEELGIELHEHQKLWYIFMPRALLKPAMKKKLGKG